MACVKYSFNSHIILTSHSFSAVDGGIAFQYISVLVSFFVVSNVSNAINRLWEARGHLGTTLHAAEMLAARAALYSSRETGPTVEIWRTNLKHRLIELVETAMHMVQHENSAHFNLLLEPLTPEAGGSHGNFTSLLDKHGYRNSTLLTKVDSFLETKDPYMLASRLEMAILSNDKYFEEPLAVVRENDLLGRSSAFLDGYVQLLKFGTTPRPYVTTQMGRTMVLVWILGLPFAITNQHAKHIFEALILVFLVTYGFIGLTMADIELHDPLGNDPNDLEGERYTKLVIQAIQDYADNGG